MNTVRCNTWVNRMRDDLLRFQMHWEREHARAPQIFAEKMTIKEWWEHFLVWTELDEGPTRKR